MTTRRVTQTLIFDLGKVICPFEVLIPCRKLAPMCGMEPMQIKQSVFFGEPETLFETGKIDEHEFTRQVNRALGLSLTTDQLRDIWAPMFELDHAMIALLEELKPTTQLILLSNTSPWHFAWIEQQFAVGRHFDELVLSYDVGYMKPAEPIYRAALDASRFRDTAVFIDDLQVNVEASVAAGLPAILFESEPKLREDLEQLGRL
ncbi:MAG: HAD family phosphatase [candidate division Zixibacteria bacterium]|jgi:putative hydrolase of the HAD superfamily|nr:HAD family phosphatase [candidate division Zixibacteria bacterium]